MATTTLGAIKDRFNTCPAFNDVQASGGLWTGEMPSEKVLPFCLIPRFKETKENTTEAAYRTQAHFTFEVYAIGAVAADSTAAKIDLAFDLPGTNEAAAAFSLQGGKVTMCAEDPEQGYMLEAVGERDASGRQVYLASRSYVLWTVKTRA